MKANLTNDGGKTVYRVYVNNSYKDWELAFTLLLKSLLTVMEQALCGREKVKRF